MDSEIIISINLLGRLGSRVEHTTYQKYTVDTLDDKTHRPITITRNILHTNRTPSSCVKEIHISPAVIQKWITDPCPHWVKPQLWKKFGREQRIYAYVASFDEGYGVFFN